MSARAIAVKATGSPASQKEARLPGLDGLRAISILMVIARHVGDRGNLFPNGSFGVTVFFVISGFLITHLLCQEEQRHGQISLRGFYRRRAYRILPAAFTYLAIIAPLAAATDLAYSVLFTRNLAGTGDATAHFWSLSVEEQFYLLWPATFLLLRTNRRRLTAMVLVVLAMPVWRYAGYHILGVQQVDRFTGDLGHDLITASFKILSGHYPILIGCCLALAREERLLRSSWLTNRWTAVAASLAAAAVLYRFQGFVPNAVFPLCTAAVIHYAVATRGAWLNWPPLAWVGRISYSLYLWQQPFCWHSTLGILGSFPVNVAASFAMACASYYLVEKPVLRFRDRNKNRMLKRARAGA